ncbi:MAG TPA: prepilin-type N-terminal cleavage/methylation domain-containing protein [Terriglobales bacterium]|nr:prepilin-type N-terminal cleavage/methylation domain-containing protein [Terriglobales bacterium]
MRAKQPSRGQRGLTLIELLIAIALTMVILAAAASVLMQSMRSSTLVVSRSEMQNELRAAANQIARDLQQAGTAVPLGGAPIPSAGTGGQDARFGCDGTACYVVNNGMSQGVLFKVTPGFNAGPVTTETTDAIVITYMDPNLDWRAYPSQTLAVDGSSVTMPAGTTPQVGDPALGITVGDVLLLQNINGYATGVVTNVDAVARQISFADKDPLNINQSTAPVGNIKALAFNPLPKAPPFYPPVTVQRLIMVTYFLQTFVSPNGPDVRLMRQVGAHPPVTLAEHIDDLKFTYDLYDDTAGVLTANLPDAVTGIPPTPKPNQIRKVNLTISARSIRPNASGQFDHVVYSTSIGPRNLSFRNRYN